MTTTQKRRNVWALVCALPVLLSLFLGAAISGSADDLEDRQAEILAQQTENDREREELASQLEDTDEELAQAVLDLQKVEGDLAVAELELADANDRYDEAKREADAINQQLLDAQDSKTALDEEITANGDRLALAQQQIGALARAAYQNPTNMTSLSIMFGAADPEDFLVQSTAMDMASRTQTQAIDELAQIQAANQNSEARLDAVEVTIADLKLEADAAEAAAAEAQQAAEDKRTEIAQLVIEQEELKKDIESRKAAEEARLAEIDRQAAELEDELTKLAEEKKKREEEERLRLEEERKKAEAEGKPAPTRPTNPGSGSGAVGAGLFKNPTSIVPMYKTSSYGWRLHPVLGYHRLHAGMDMRTYCGTPLYAARAGVVEWARYRSGLGNQVMIDHGFHNGQSLMSSYNHMTSFAVGAGAVVSQGDLIGYAGNTGTSTACHLHFEVYVDGKTVDPEPLF